MTDWKDVKKELIAIAHAFDVPITEQKVTWYCKIWKDMTPEKVLEGLIRWSMETKNRRLPLPGEIIDRVPGEIVAGKVLEAITKFGYTDPLGAKEYLGEAWLVVLGLGGWRRLCESEWTSTDTAQARDLWNRLKGATNGTYRQLSGCSKPEDSLEGTDSRTRAIVRGVPEFSGPHKFDGSKDLDNSKPRALPLPLEQD